MYGILLRASQRIADFSLGGRRVLIVCLGREPCQFHPIWEQPPHHISDEKAREVHKSHHADRPSESRRYQSGSRLRCPINAPDLWKQLAKNNGEEHPADRRAEGNDAERDWSLILD